MKEFYGISRKRRLSESISWTSQDCWAAVQYFEQELILKFSSGFFSICFRFRSSYGTQTELSFLQWSGFCFKCIFYSFSSHTTHGRRRNLQFLHLCTPPVQPGKKLEKVRTFQKGRPERRKESGYKEASQGQRKNAQLNIGETFKNLVELTEFKFSTLFLLLRLLQGFCW